VPDRLDARAVALMLLLTAIWGGSYTFVKLGFRDLPVFASLFLRMVVASALLLAYSRLAAIPLLYPRRGTLFLLGAIGAFVWSQVPLYAGLTLTTAGRGSIFFNTQPFFTLALLPLFVAEETFTLRKLAGTALAFAGVALLFLERLGTEAGGGLLGDGLVLLGALGWTATNILTKTMPREVHPASFILWSAAGALPVMGALTLLLEPGQPWRLTPLALASLLYLGGVAAAFSFVAFTWLIRHYPALQVNAFVFLSPVFGLLIGWAALGEPLSLAQGAGALLVGGGIWLVNTGGA
jgi:drug/metabolite transporter (DMT)-like permease